MGQLPVCGRATWTWTWAWCFLIIRGCCRCVGTALFLFSSAFNWRCWASIIYRTISALGANRHTNSLAKTNQHVVDLSPFVSRKPLLQGLQHRHQYIIHDIKWLSLGLMAYHASKFWFSSLDPTQPVANSVHVDIHAYPFHSMEQAFLLADSVQMQLEMGEKRRGERSAYCCQASSMQR